MHGSLPSPQPCWQPPILRDNRGLAGSQMLLPKAGKRLQALLELLWDQRVRSAFLHRPNLSIWGSQLSQNAVLRVAPGLFDPSIDPPFGVKPFSLLFLLPPTPPGELRTAWIFFGGLEVTFR